MPALTAKEAFEALIGQFGIGYGHFAEELLRSWRITTRARGPDAMPEQLINEHVGAAEEEAGHGRHIVDRLTIGQPPFQGPYVGLRHSLVVLDGEEQRNVDRQAVVQHLLNRRHPRGGTGNFDEHVGAVHGVV